MITKSFKKNSNLT